jgi:hypothetical protein
LLRKSLAARASGACGPKLLHSGDRFALGHCGDLSFAQVGAGEQQVDKLCWQRFFGWCWYSTVWRHAVLNASPESGLVYTQLIPKDVTPDLGTISIPVDWVGDPGPHDPAIVKMQFVGDMVSASTATCVSDWLPTFVLAKDFMILARWRRPGQRTSPTSHPRN